MARAGRGRPRYSARRAREKRACLRDRDACCESTAPVRSFTRNGPTSADNGEQSKRNSDGSRDREPDGSPWACFRILRGLRRASTPCANRGSSSSLCRFSAKASPEMSAFIERTLGSPQSLESHDLGPLMARDRWSPRCRAPIRAWRSSASPGPCGAWDFRRTTAAFFTCSPAVVACSSRFTVSHGPRTHSPCCTRTAAEMPPSAPGQDASERSGLRARTED